MSQEQLAIFCAAGCADGAMQRILISPTDAVAICPNCKRSYGVVTRRLEGLAVKRLPDGRYRYLLKEGEAHGGRRLRKVETAQRLGLQPGSRITLVRRGPILIGLTDHDREIWFSIEPAPNRLRGAKRFLDFMSGVILFCVLLTAITYLTSIHQYLARHGISAAILLVAPLVLTCLLPPLVRRLQARLSARSNPPSGTDSQALPPLKLPDID